MVQSSVNQEAVMQFIREVDEAREQFRIQDMRPRRVRTSPLDYHDIAESTSDKKEDLTAWLGRRCDDPAFKVRLYLLRIAFLISIYRIFYLGLRTTCSLEPVVWNTRVPSILPVHDASTSRII